MDNSLKEIASIIIASFEKQKNQFPELADVDLELVFKLDLVHFVLFCSMKEPHFSSVELQFLNQRLDLNLDYEYIQQYLSSIPSSDTFKLPSSFLIANLIDHSSSENELLNTCYMFYQLFGQEYFQLRQFLPETTDRFVSLLRDLERYVQTASSDTDTDADDSADRASHTNQPPRRPRMDRPSHTNETSSTNQSAQSEDSEEPPLPPRSEANLKKCMDQLNSMTGLQKVKDDVQSLINMIVVQKKREELGITQNQPLSLHLVFTGNPGTGKTTIARLLAQIYYQLGLLSKGQLVETDRSGLVAGYIGQTAIKTQEVIQKAIGGILFIDEAYTLKQNYSNDFGQESIDTLLKAMEDNRDDLIVIVAGYPDLMQEFIKSNPGLQSRFNKYLKFEDYSPEELVEIFQSLCKSYGMVANEEVVGILKEKLTANYQNRDKNFGNGRLVRNIIEKIYTNQANRIAGNIDNCSKEDVKQILPCDLPAQFE